MLAYFSLSPGRINVGYLYQQPGLAVLPNELMGNYDLCRFAREYSPTPFDTQYCALARDTAGVCVPAACTAEDLKDPGLIQPLINLAVQATMGVRAYLRVTLSFLIRLLTRYPISFPVFVGAYGLHFRCLPYPEMR